MTPDEAENAMVEEFLTQWGATSLVLLRNQDDDPPEEKVAWVRISVDHNDADQAAIGGEPGNQFFRRYGFIFVQCFVPTGTATQQLNALAYQAQLVFEGKEIEGIWFRNCRIVDVPLVEKKWAQKNFIGEFIYDDIH